MDIDGLKDFVTLADCKSFSRAATIRNITQPAFSRRIQALENVVGAPLIDRTKKDFTLSAAGRRFLVHARHLADAADGAVTDAQSVTTAMDDPVYLVTPGHVSKTFFPGWYKKLQKSIPGLTMRVTHQSGSQAIADLRRGIADFALVLKAKDLTACYDFAGLETRVVGTDRMVAVCAKHTKNADHFLMYEKGSHMAACAEAVLGKRVKTGKTVFESSSTGLLKEMALAGFGTAVIQESLVEDDLIQGFLQPAFRHTPLGCDILLVRGSTFSTKNAQKLWGVKAS